MSSTRTQSLDMEYWSEVKFLIGRILKHLNLHIAYMAKPSKYSGKEINRLVKKKDTFYLKNCNIKFLIISSNPIKNIMTSK